MDGDPPSMALVSPYSIETGGPRSVHPWGPGTEGAPAAIRRG